MISMSVKPASSALCPLTLVYRIEPSIREFVKAKHGCEQRADNRRNNQSHNDRNERDGQRDDTLHHEPGLFFMDIGGFKRHRGELSGFFPKLEQVNRPL